MSYKLMNCFFCAAMLITSAAAVAAPTQMSEQLGDWQHAQVAEQNAAAPKTPLALKSASDINQSVIKELVLLKGRAMLGTPYVFGSNGIGGVDCSALIQQLFESAGIALPRTTRDLASIGEPVSSQSLLPGDLLFYRWSKHRMHVAVYAGDGMVIHASPGERGVVISTLNQTWQHHFIAARRITA